MKYEEKDVPIRIFYKEKKKSKNIRIWPILNKEAVE